MIYPAFVLYFKQGIMFITIIVSLCFKLCFVFLNCIIYSPTCQTVVSDPFLWYSGPIPVIAFEEEQEEAVGEPQLLVKWQADNVM